MMKIIDSIKNSLSKKLLISFIFVGFLPFMILYFYTLNLAQDTLIEKIFTEQKIQANIIVNAINDNILNLSKEVRFISQLDIMNDMIVKDLDKRISRILYQKREDINQEISLYAISTQNIIISSSDSTKLNKHFFKKSGFIYISSNIFSSFDKGKLLGKLVLEYDIKNLSIFFRKQYSVHNAIVDKKSDIICGKLPFRVDIKSNFNTFISKEHLIVYKKLNPPLNDLYFVYAIDKEVALDFLNKFLNFMIYIIPFIILIIIVVSVYISKLIVNPIKDFTILSEKIIKTKNYNQKVVVNSSDEIGRLAISFNQLLTKTQNVLDTLEVENQLRLKRFVQLINIFTKIAKTTSEEECITVSIKEISKLIDKDLHFVKEHKTNSKSIPIYVTDFYKNKKVYFGEITLDISKFSDKNEKSLILLVI